MYRLHMRRGIFHVHLSRCSTNLLEYSVHTVFFLAPTIPNTLGGVAAMSGFIAKAIGIRASMISGCLIFCVGTLTSYWTLDANVSIFTKVSLSRK